MSFTLSQTLHAKAQHKHNATQNNKTTTQHTTQPNISTKRTTRNTTRTEQNRRTESNRTQTVTHPKLHSPTTQRNKTTKQRHNTAQHNTTQHNISTKRTTRNTTRTEQNRTEEQNRQASKATQHHYATQHKTATAPGSRPTVAASGHTPLFALAFQIKDISLHSFPHSLQDENLRKEKSSLRRISHISFCRYIKASEGFLLVYSITAMRTFQHVSVCYANSTPFAKSYNQNPHVYQGAPVQVCP